MVNLPGNLSIVLVTLTGGRSLGHERAAYVYVRQSSPRQVVEHLESRRRQYERVEWARRRLTYRTALRLIGIARHARRWLIP